MKQVIYYGSFIAISVSMTAAGIKLSDWQYWAVLISASTAVVASSGWELK